MIRIVGCVSRISMQWRTILLFALLLSAMSAYGQTFNEVKVGMGTVYGWVKILIKIVGFGWVLFFGLKQLFAGRLGEGGTIAALIGTVAAILVFSNLDTLWIAMFGDNPIGTTTTGSGS